jgi:HipA-like protein
MRQAKVYRNNDFAGILVEKTRNEYVYKYDDTYFNDPSKPAISLTLPKSKQEYKSNVLFPFFFNMLSEGVNKKLQCQQLRIDENDNLGLLLATAQFDTIGAVTIKPID